MQKEYIIYKLKNWKNYIFLKIKNKIQKILRIIQFLKKKHQLNIMGMFLNIQI